MTLFWRALGYYVAITRVATDLNESPCRNWGDLMGMGCRGCSAYAIGSKMTRRNSLLSTLRSAYSSLSPALPPSVFVPRLFYISSAFCLGSSLSLRLFLFCHCLPSFSSCSVSRLRPPLSFYISFSRLLLSVLSCWLLTYGTVAAAAEALSAC